MDSTTWSTVTGVGQGLDGHAEGGELFRGADVEVDDLVLVGDRAGAQEDLHDGVSGQRAGVVQFYVVA